MIGYGNSNVANYAKDLLFHDGKLDYPSQSDLRRMNMEWRKKKGSLTYREPSG